MRGRRWWIGRCGCWVGGRGRGWRGGRGGGGAGGWRVGWGQMSAVALVRLLEDARPAVVDRAMVMLGKGDEAVVAALAEAVADAGRSATLRRNALWALNRIG